MSENKEGNERKESLSSESALSFGHLGNCLRPEIRRKSPNFGLIVLYYTYIII